MKPDDETDAWERLTPDGRENLLSMWNTIYVVADNQFTDEQIMCAWTIARGIDEYGYPPVLPNGLTPMFLMAVYGAIALHMRVGFEITTGAHMENLIHHAFRFYRNQRNNASKPRGKTVAGITIKEMIREVMLAQPKCSKARELWPHLYSTLEKYDLEPEEKESSYSYRASDSAEDRKAITFKTFENNLTEIKKSR